MQLGRNGLTDPIKAQTDKAVFLSVANNRGMRQIGIVCNSIADMC